MHVGTARHAGAFHTECMQRPPSEGPHAPCPRRAGGTAPSAHLAIQPIPCNKRQHLTELRTSPSLLLLRLRPALPRLRLLLALLPVLGPCQRAQPQAGLQEAGLSFKEQRAAAKKPPPSTPRLQPGCRSWATKTQPQGRRVEGGEGQRRLLARTAGSSHKQPWVEAGPTPASPICQLRQQGLQDSFASPSAAKQVPGCNRPQNRTPHQAAR